MNREIKFRGIREEYNSVYHDSVFKYGNLLNTNSIGEVGHDLTHYEYAKVKPETIGQYTGLKDKNGKEIYEGDIMQKWEDCGIEDEPYKKWEASGFEGEWPQKESATIDVCDISTFGYWLKNECFGYEGEDLQSPEEWEIIGNIHENPELITKP